MSTYKANYDQNGELVLRLEGEDGQPQISMTLDLPEGNVSEKMQLNQGLQDALISRALGSEQ